jgi:DNA-binding MarR family transcriptional regulator
VAVFGVLTDVAPVAVTVVVARDSAHGLAARPGRQSQTVGPDAAPLVPEAAGPDEHEAASRQAASRLPAASAKRLTWYFFQNPDRQVTCISRIVVVCLPMATNATPPYRFGSLLALARQSWIDQVRERMQAAGFPGYRRSDAGMLGLLLQQPRAIGQLGDALGISRQAARQLADGLAERGYVSFGADEADARRTLVLLTPSGRAYGRAIWAAQDTLNRAVRDRVSAADLAAADTVLRAVFPDDHTREQATGRLAPPGANP